MSTFVTALVVTHNRKALLQRCLVALHSQTRRPDRIVVVDNASTDGTRQALKEAGWLACREFELIELSENCGGAGGFAYGIKYAVERGTQWVWLMDDDATPHSDALEQLRARTLDDKHLYASIAVCGDRLSWPLQPDGSKAKSRICSVEQMPSELHAHFAPFLGLMVSSTIVSRIGLPDAGFFLAADDVDYSLRAKKAGAAIVVVRDSRIEHPQSQSYSLRFFPRVITLRLSPWKRYYDVRNRILVARSHYGSAFYYATLPGTLLRVLAVLINEQDRLQQIRAFAAGLVDGLLGRKGRRHDLWGIRQ